MATKLLRKPAVLDRVPFSESTLNRKVKDRTFPAPVKVSDRAIAWREPDIIAWEESLPVVQPQADEAAGLKAGAKPPRVLKRDRRETDAEEAATWAKLPARPRPKRS